MNYQKPEVFLVAETKINKNELEAFLSTLGVPNWETDASSDTETLVEIGWKLCYLSFRADLNKNLTKTGSRNNLNYIQDGIVKNKHGSVIEHASVTFILLNVSRVLTHELVRHRAGTAFSQLSGRYVRTDSITMADLPSVISENPKATEIFDACVLVQEQVIQMLSELYGLDNMSDFHKKKVITSAIRRIIGNGQANHIMFSANHRALRHMIEMRTNVGAEEEIRIVFNKIFEKVKDKFPALYADAQVECIDGINQVTFKYNKV